MSTPQQVLNKYFGYPSFRSGQKKIIDSILTKKDTLALMPTGAGKSICFQIPGLIMPGLTLVISPLISLMADQVKQLKKRKIKAVFINSSLSKKELSARLRRIRKNYYQFIYLAPERLTSSSWQAISPDLKISLVAVDEAHCASMWGHDFRPSYQQIAAYLKTLNQRPVVAAFTATATLQVRADICKMLALRSPKIVVQDFLRTNLNLNILLVKSRAQKVAVLYKILKNHCGQAGIVYCAARQTCQTLSTLINYHNFNEI